MGNCIEKLPHSCGSKDALQVFEEAGKYTGYCYACDTYIADPYNGKAPALKPRITKTPEQIEAELAEIATLPTVAIPSRSLKKESLEHFGIKIALSEQDGHTPVVRYFPITRDGQLIGYKAKLIPTKQMWSVGNTKGGKDLFGWEQALASGAKKLFITEGEDDAVALYQAFKDKSTGTQWASAEPAVVSLTDGAGGTTKCLTHNLAKIRHSFKEVIFVFDRDQAGQKATQDAMQVIPTARSVNLPDKDPNECVINGRSLALANACLFKTETPKNTRIVIGSAMYEAGRKQAEYGLSFPWTGLTDLTRGMRFGETYYFGSGVKMGKSTIRSALATHLIREHGIKVFLAAPEETNRKTWQLVCSQAVGKIFHDPKVEFDFEAYDEASKIIGDNLYLLNLYQHLGWDSLRSDIMVAAEAGCKAVFIDPITNLTNGVSSGEANTALQEIAQELAAIAMDLELIIWIFCHLKAPDSGEPHERGGKVQSYQFAGSRAMMRSCNMMVGFEGNKDPDLPEEIRNRRRIILLEDREFGASGVVPVHYNVKTGLYSEIKE